MELFDAVPFSVDEKDFDVRILYDDASINVVAFHNGYPANGYRYQVKLPKGCSAVQVLERHSVPELVEKCKNDIRDNTWESLSAIIAENTVKA